MKIVIDIPEKTNAHIRSDFGHGYLALRDEDKGILCYAVYHGTPYEERPHGEWIPCSERLPEIRFDLNSRTSDTVFVCLENRTMHMAFYCDDDVWRFCESGEAKEPMWDKVIAWMPLPERYGEEARRNESDHL